ncbi:MAG: ATP-dependent zinc metalloprotease FtsH [Clostridiales bacterium]|nr:ATP-dependent zinc metalloprotease FtsH [Clostridiales bacterium]
MKKYFRGLTFYILIFIVILYFVRMFWQQPQQIELFNFTELLNEIDSGNVMSIDLADNRISGMLNDGTYFESYIPSVMSNSFGDYVFNLAKEKDVAIDLVGVPPVETPWFVDILPSVFMILIFVVFWFVFMQNSQGGGNKVMSFGKSKAKLNKPDEGKIITFEDVAGLKEEKEELIEIVDFLKYPKKYIDLGARIPKGILMVGPPGTGKTYLSRAVAGEAGVPFYSISGSDFVEMFVGVGASRVRDLFDTAKKNSPCIIFIDEIDAVGRKRGAGLGGGHDEREQTLNQLLVEMDGFGDHEGVIIIAATNRPDILDTALLRPGRFDREVTVGIPDVIEREAILKVHSKNKPMDPNVDFKVLARRTPGFTPADLENILNESALISARRNNSKIKMETIEEATTKVIAGVEKKSRVISEKERKITAYHESGHAILAKLLPDMDPVHQVTIIPRGRAGGFTMQLPSEDRSYMTQKRMENDLIVLLGGRVAEKIILNDISTGAQNDLSRVTQLAKAMVTKYAMSENLSQMSYADEEEVFLGRDMTTRKNYSEHVAAEIDREIRRIVDNAYDEAYRLLTENENKIHELAQALLEFETVHAEDFEIVFNEGFEALKVFKEAARKTKEAMEESEKQTEKVENIEDKIGKEIDEIVKETIDEENTHS